MTTHKPLFGGLIVDENDQIVEVSYVGSEPHYVVNDAGFHRHIPTIDVDRQVVTEMKELIEGHEDIITEHTAKMWGKDDLFSRAIIQNQLKNFDKQFENLLKTGIPEEGRAYMGMMGFRIVVNVHGEVIRLEQPGLIPGDEGME